MRKDTAREITFCRHADSALGNFRSMADWLLLSIPHQIKLHCPECREEGISVQATALPDSTQAFGRLGGQHTYCIPHIVFNDLMLSLVFAVHSRTLSRHLYARSQA